MLKYSITLNREEVKMTELEWAERYVAQDLSFFSGVTSIDNHLENLNRIYVEYSKDETRVPFDISAVTVNRQGYIVLKNKKYEVKSGNTVTYGDDLPGSGTSENFTYIDFNSMHIMSGNSGFTIHDVLYEFSVGKIVEKDVTLTPNGGNCVMDTVVWIEDGVAEIDGRKYTVDFESFSADGSMGALIDEFGNYVLAKDICDCDGMGIHKFYKAIEVTKFVIRPSEFQILDVDRIATCGYENFVVYNGERYAVKKEYVDGGDYIDWKYMCFGDIFPGSGTSVYVDIGASGETPATKENICGSSIYEITDLTYFDAYIKIGDEKVMVLSTIVEKPLGNFVAIYLKGYSDGLSVGDKIVGTFNDGESEIEVLSYVSGTSTSSTASDRYVIYNGTKYEVIPNLISKVDTSGDSEERYYVIDRFSSDGKAFVEVDEELVPMSANTSHTKVRRYGNIVTSSTSTSNLKTYNVVKADGVEIFGKKYEVLSATSESGTVKEYIVIEDGRKIVFTINDIVGSSMLVCEAFIDQDEVDKVSRMEYDVESATYAAANQNDSAFRKVDESIHYGELTPATVYKYKFNGENSMYDDILDSLRIYLNNGYATFRLPMTLQGGENPLQEDVTENEFFLAEKEKAVNKIVDMEKDVYTPKTLVRESGTFEGANEKYNPIYELDFNLHFRTRDLNTWKVLEDGVDESGNSISYGWFVTDYYPYNDRGEGEVLMETSDLYGLMYFNDMDVLYQKNNLSRSFIRLSYYDSPNPQTQSLLGTSCVFVDGSAAFKKYADNSKKIKDSYEMVGYKDATEIFFNKINTNSEKSDEDTYDETKRMSSRLIVKNKYESKGSSEGFYLYVFREYSSGLHPKQIFMKAEFNHAKIGRVIPLVIPMNWKKTDDTYYPTSAKTFNEISANTSGYPLEAVIAQQYIPLYAVFDYEKKEYGYVFDDRYVTVEDGVAKLNLFELKIRDDSNASGATKDIYEINVNDKFIE